MILLGTHIWVWWVMDVPRLTALHQRTLASRQAAGLGVSIISCWEVAKLVEIGRLALPVPVASWIDAALAYPGMRLIDLTPRIAIESTQLPGVFHRDPADQIIVATAREHDWELVTVDERILACPHGRAIASSCACQEAVV